MALANPKDCHIQQTDGRKIEHGKKFLKKGS